MGLAIADQIADENDIIIHLESEPGEGTKVELVIPLAKE